MTIETAKRVTFETAAAHACRNVPVVAPTERGLSVGVAMRRMASRELAVGLAIGLALAVVATPLVWWRWGDPNVALAVGLAVFAACSTATLAAMALPWLFDRLGLDPAFASGPLATVILDLLSILIYFGIATAVVA